MTFCGGQRDAVERLDENKLTALRGPDQSNGWLSHSIDMLEAKLSRKP